MTNTIIKLLSGPEKGFEWLTRSRRFYVLLLVLFLFRLAYGLTEKFFDTDEMQSYLIGLRAFTTDVLPAWGPDSMYKVKSRLAGGLMGLLIYLPLKVWPIPESPVIALNILSFSVLCFLGFYIQKRIPDLPRWLIWMYVLTSPWTLHFSTYIINPSYVLVPAVLFFVPFTDRIGLYDQSIIRRNLSYALMGFALMWQFQVHMSWVLIGPFGLWLIIHDWDTLRRLAKDLVFGMIGGIIPALALIPTLQFLLITPLGGTENNITFNIDNLLMAPQFLARLIAMSTLEIARYTSHIELLIHQLDRQMWLLPLVVALALGSIFHLAYFLFALIGFKHPLIGRVRRIFWISASIVFGSFFFSIKPPISYTFYIAFPLVLMLSLHLLEIKWKPWRLGLVFSWLLCFNIVFQLAHMVYGYSYKSLYTDREAVADALKFKEHTLMNTRRVAYFEEPDVRELCSYQMSDNGPIKQSAIVCSFEYLDDNTRPQNISSSKSSEGRFALVINNHVPFGPAFTLPQNKFLENADSLVVEFDYWAESDERLVLVTDVKSTDQWHGYTVPLIRTTKHWRHFKSTYFLPDGFRRQDVELFFWKQAEHKNLIYVDRLKISEKSD